jgi:ATP-dependent helicase HrpB
MRPLPIDPRLPEIVEAVRTTRALVLEAEPGAGKTTRVPAALLAAGVAGTGKIVVTEPRRLPARLAATFVAAELGEPVGRTSGYSVRFEHVAGRDTRILYVTEGVLLRRLLEDPTLSDVSVVVLDEFHERHLVTDVLLALVDRLQRGPRPDLRLVVMSATLDAEGLASHLGAARLRSEGRAFPLTIEHETRADDRPLERRVASAVRRILDEEKAGDVLVFLPGAREIRDCTAALQREAGAGSALVLPLHGDLSVAEQARAVEPTTQRRVILSTNVAESSVTIEGVTAVVDTGLARVAGHSPWTGLPTLTTAKISRASATQRAGRAGRTRPGRVIRLYSSGDLATRPEHDKPEILRSDLAEAWLSLHGAGVTEPSTLGWLDPPPASALSAAEGLLRRLGALDAHGALTGVGRRMLAFPLPPRLARVVVEGERRGVAEEASLAAALLSERDLRSNSRADLGSGARGGARARSGDAGGPSDVLEMMDRFREAADAGFDARRLGHMGIDARTAKAVERAAHQISGAVQHGGPRPPGVDAVDRAVQIALLAGFPDRLARRRARGESPLTLFTGRTARLAETSVVHAPMLMVALDAEDAAGRGAVVRLASGVEADWIFELYPDMVEMTDEVSWNSSSEQVDRVSRIACGSVVIDEERKPAQPSAEASALLLKAARARTPPWQEVDETVGPILVRLLLLGRHLPEAKMPDIGAEVLEAAIARACEGKTRFAELADVQLGQEILAALTAEQRALLQREAPERVTLPGGKAVTVHYDAGKPPWIESRLQDFFGMTRTPAVFKGRVPLTVHLLAPNHRAVQVTTDLAGFWERHYAGIRRELSRRYPRHPWPEDGGAAAPPPPRPARQRPSRPR